MKKIAYVLADFPVFSETFVGNEIRAMPARGHEIVPIVLRHHDGPAQEEDLLLAASATYVANIPSRRAYEEMRRPGIGAVRALSFVANQQTLPRYSLLGTSLKIAAVAREHGCDHIHAHFAKAAAAHAIVAARWIGATVSFTCHGSDVNKHPEDLHLKLDKADLAIGVCSEMVEAFTEYGPKARLAMVPCGTNPDRFQPAPTKTSNGKLLYVGRLSPSKGVDDLIDAVARLGDNCRKIDVVGDGPLGDALHKRAKEVGAFGTRMNFLGSKPAEWIATEAPFYHGVVLPFKPAPDGQRDANPLVVKETMSMGLPLLSTRMSGMIDTISEDTGFLVEPGNVHALSEAMVRLSNLTEDDRWELGKRARARICTHFSLDAQARILSGLIETLGTPEAEIEQKAAA